jgi:hypothetical protein
LFFTPVVVPVTFTVTTQETPLAAVPPARLTLDEPAIAVAVPPQVLLSAGVAATTKPAGRASVKAKPVRGNGLLAELVRVNDRLVEPFSGIFRAPNAFRMEGGVATVRLAVAVLPVPPFVEVTLPVVFTN